MLENIKNEVVKMLRHADMIPDKAVGRGCKIDDHGFIFTAKNGVSIAMIKEIRRLFYQSFAMTRNWNIGIENGLLHSILEKCM